MIYSEEGIRNYFVYLFSAFLFFPIVVGVSECSSPDVDLDGWTEAEGDCDDSDPAVYPGALERCDGVDSNCDNQPDPSFLWYMDADEDGAGDPAVSQEGCTAPAGTVANAEDCDDTAPARSPAAQEQCDLLDNDCDGVVDEHLLPYRYRDADGDGFGDEWEVVCQDTPGYVQALGDCDDARADIHPGAADSAGDGVDQDCGGSAGPEPSLGYPSSKQTSLSQALALASEGITIWVGPGTWSAVELALAVPMLSLRGSHRAEQTILTAQQQGRHLSLAGVSGVWLDGLTFREGSAQGNGGALFVSNSELRLTDCNLEENETTYTGTAQDVAGLGGAIYLDQSQADIRRSSFLSNFAYAAEHVDTEYGESYLSGGGGAIGAFYSQLQIQSASFVQNGTTYVGGDPVWANGSTLLGVTSNVTMMESSVQGSGGHAAIMLFGDTLHLSNSSVSDGHGSVVLIGGEAVVRENRFRNLDSGGFLSSGAYGSIEDNTFENMAGAAMVLNFTPSGKVITVARNLIQGCRSSYKAVGAIDLDGGNAYLVNNTILGNSLLYGGIGGEACSLVLRNNILAYNSSYNLYELPDYPCNIDVSYNTFFNPSGRNYNNGTLDSSNSLEDPRFIRYSPNRNSDDDDLHLLPSSPVKHASDGSMLNPDGTLPEHGMYVQTSSATRYYADAEQDGLYDGWELQNGSSPSKVDVTSDPDGDGLTQEAELTSGTWGTRADSDQDGAADGEEVHAGSHPLDWYSRTGRAGEVTLAVAQVPGDFPTIQSAIEAIWQRGEIAVAGGVRYERLWISDRAVQLRSQSPEDPFVLDGENENVVVQVFWGALELSHATIQRGLATSSDQSAGLYVKDSVVALNHVLVTNNMAGDWTDGTIEVNDSDLTLLDTRISGNVAYGNAGIRAIKSRVTFDGLEVSDNISTGGVTMLFASCEVIGTRLFVLNNEAEDGASGVYLNEGSIDISYALFMRNTTHDTREGAAFEIFDGSGALRFATFVGNTSTSASGGIRLWGLPTQRLVMENVILAYNTPTNLFTSDIWGGTTSPMPVLTKYTTFYNPDETTNFNYLSPGSTYLVQEPGFLSYSGGLPVDPHLSTASALLNTGEPGLQDADGTRADPGIFGGPEGNLWDMDLDGMPGYFWPGMYADVPSGIDSTLYDSDELNALLP